MQQVKTCAPEADQDSDGAGRPGDEAEGGAAAARHEADHPARPEGLRPAGHLTEGRGSGLLCDEQSDRDQGPDVHTGLHTQDRRSSNLVLIVVVKNPPS